MKVLISAVLGGVLMFAWGAAAHMATPLGHMGWKSIPNEAVVLRGLDLAVPDSGLYMFPGAEPEDMKDPRKAAERAQNIQGGPSGILAVAKKDGATFGAKTMALEFATNFVCALLIACVLRLGTFSAVGNRILAGGLIGLFGAVSINGSFWIWYGFPQDFTLAALVMESVGGLVGAIPPALMLKGRAA